MRSLHSTLSWSSRSLSSDTPKGRAPRHKFYRLSSSLSDASLLGVDPGEHYQPEQH